MKKLATLLLLFAASLQTLQAQKTQEGFSVSLSGLNAEQMRGYTFSIKWADLIKKHPELKADNFKVIDVQTEEEIPYQLEYRGQKSVQNLLVQLNPQADILVHFIRLVPGQAKAFPTKVYGRYVPERKDDFAWENDKVAFRMYGKALEATNENAYGIDIWAKRTDSMVIDQWYKSGDYHKDHGQGLDYYSVGYTLGGGDIAPFTGNKIHFPKNYRNWKVLDKGPIRFTFQLDYDEWDVAGRKVKVSKLISLDAGSQLNRVEATFTFAGAEPLPVAIGIVKRKEPGHSVLSETSGLMSYWEPAHGDDGTLGIAALLGDRPAMMSTSDTHLLIMASVQSGKPIVYYNGAAWSKAVAGRAGRRPIRWDASSWNMYLQNFAAAREKNVAIGIQ
ncbi:DUF4861 family protein [Pedobacter faecalis]|uniref:DUF4861 family protein n=1 Tax=Pedobacter faecalis TaxID=3041495 RepID=UPI00254CAF52|nr:DUF4861 family protein [Pedobacter sp. ELA7]